MTPHEKMKARSSRTGLSSFVDLIGRYSKLRHPHDSLELQRIREGAQRGRSISGQPAKVRDLGRRLGQARIEQLVADYQSGTPTPELMTTYQLSKTAVLKLLKDAGITMRRQPVTEEQVSEAAELYRSGLSLNKISEQMVLPHESIRRALVEFGVQMRSRGRVSG